MSDSENIKALCNAICSSFYPDDSAVQASIVAVMGSKANEGVENRILILRASILLVMGYVEGSRSEGGISVSVRSEDAIRKSIAVWCNAYGLDIEEELKPYSRVIENGSNLW